MGKIKISIIAVTMFTALCSNTQAQSGLGLAVYDDLKLLVRGDSEHGIEKGTNDFVVRFLMEGNQQKWGYVIVFPEFEYAQICGNYKRYSAGVGYVFNKLILNNAELGFNINYGWIDRYGKSMFSGGGGIVLSYKLNKVLKLSILNQFTDRRDLKYLWNDDKTLAYSLMGGFEVKF